MRSIRSAKVSEMPSWPVHSKAEVSAVARVLLSGCTNQWSGPDVADFESAFASWLGVEHAIAVSSGTSALAGALHGLEIGPGADIIVPGRSFIATASVPLQIGARPIFADVSAVNGNVTVDTLEAARTKATRCVIPVHLDGWPCDMLGICDWAERHGILVVEDCAQAQGAEVRGVRVGRFGHTAAFSFCHDKIMSTGGEGGMVVTDSGTVAARVRSWRDHGRSIDAQRNGESSGFRWQVERIGGNSRMSSMQAAIGLVQMDLVDGWLDQRSQNAIVLRAALRKQPDVACPSPSEGVRHAYYRLTSHIPSAVRDSVLAKLQNEGWPVRSGPCPELYRERLFCDLGLAPKRRLPTCSTLSDVTLSLPVHPTATEVHMRLLAAAIARAGVGSTNVAPTPNALL
jgi:dTDP-4-amino-4,6-dideoxygalactose transaminase